MREPLRDRKNWLNAMDIVGRRSFSITTKPLCHQSKLRKKSMPTEPEHTEVIPDAELSDQDLEVVVGGQGTKPPTGSGPFDPTPDPEPQAFNTGFYNPRST